MAVDYKMRRYTAFTRGINREVVRIPLQARNDADAAARAVYQCEGLRRVVAPVRDLTRSMAYILLEVTCDDDNGREVWINPLIERYAAEPCELYLQDRERGWI